MGRILLVLVIGCLLFPASAAAQVVINEFVPNPVGDDSSGEWVELYNQSDEAVTLHNWLLEDDSQNRLVLTVQIEAHGWSVIDRDNAPLSLNNSGDVIRLFDATESGQLVDQVEYDSSSEGLSWGRLPDGIGEWRAKLPATAGNANQLPTPSPTPIPTASPKPTNTPKPETGDSHDSEVGDSSSSEPDDENQSISDSNSEIPLFEEVLGESSFSATLSAVGIVDLATASSSESAWATPHSQVQKSFPWLWFLGGGVLLSAGVGPGVRRLMEKWLRDMRVD